MCVLQMVSRVPMYMYVIDGCVHKIYASLIGAMHIYALTLKLIIVQCSLKHVNSI